MPRLLIKIIITVSPHISTIDLEESCQYFGDYPGHHCLGLDLAYQVLLAEFLGPDQASSDSNPCHPWLARPWVADDGGFVAFGG